MSVTKEEFDRRHQENVRRLEELERQMKDVQKMSAVTNVRLTEILTIARYLAGITSGVAILVLADVIVMGFHP